MAMNIELETSVGMEDGRAQWALCMPGGGDEVLRLSSHLSEADQERIAKAIAAAFPTRT